MVATPLGDSVQSELDLTPTQCKLLDGRDGNLARQLWEEARIKVEVMHQNFTLLWFQGGQSPAGFEDVHGRVTGSAARFLADSVRGRRLLDYFRFCRQPTAFSAGPDGRGSLCISPVIGSSSAAAAGSQMVRLIAPNSPVSFQDPVALGLVGWARGRRALPAEISKLLLEHSWFCRLLHHDEGEGPDLVAEEAFGAFVHQLRLEQPGVLGRALVRLGERSTSSTS